MYLFYTLLALDSCSRVLSSGVLTLSIHLLIFYIHCPKSNLEQDTQNLSSFLDNEVLRLFVKYYVFLTNLFVTLLLDFNSFLKFCIIHLVLVLFCKMFFLSKQSWSHIIISQCTMYILVELLSTLVKFQSFGNIRSF